MGVNNNIKQTLKQISYLPLAILSLNNSSNERLTWFTLISSFLRFVSASMSNGERGRYFSRSAGDTEFLC